MKTKYILHKLPEGFIVTSNEKIKKDDIKWHHVTGIRQALVDGNYTNQFKVIAQQDQIDFSGLSEEEQKEIGWFDLYVEAQNYAISTKSPNREAHRAGYVKGFQKAQELLSDRRFTLEDIEATKDYGNHQREMDAGKIPYVTFEEFIQSLSPNSWKVELETETIKGEYIGRKQISVTPSGEPTYINEGYEEILQPKLTNGKITITKIL
jgi:DNA-dependent RNA polymerase auxiliary subunit epsilon